MTARHLCSHSYYLGNLGMHMVRLLAMLLMRNRLGHTRWGGATTTYDPRPNILTLTGRQEKLKRKVSNQVQRSRDRSRRR